MLVQLSIRDIVLIDRLDLDFGPGLTVLTGETGAGKSILLDAFSLALGGRGDGGLVRAGQAQGQVTAIFDPPLDHKSRKIAAGLEIDVEGELILRRVQMADGRSRAFVNESVVSVQSLRAIGAALVEIHGQHDDRVLIDPDMHRALLDAFGGHDALLLEVRSSWAELRKAEKLLRDEQLSVEAARKEADFLSHAHEELSKLKARVGEEQELSEQRAKMMQAEKVAADLRDAQDSVSGDGSPLSTLSAALRRLDRRQPQAPELIDPPLKALDAALTALDVAAQALDQALRDAEFDPRALELTEERLFALRGASRKFSVAADQLPALCEKFGEDLAAIDAGEERLKQLFVARDAAEAAYVAAAEKLSGARKLSSVALDAAIQSELPPLKLERAIFSTHVSAAEARGPEGFEKVEFWVQTNPGAKPGPLMKVASGGELSRFMLALKVALADRGAAPTLVFDEIDSGAGGAAADAIGQRLARLGANVQVLSVTHAPQVAARATLHMRISKDLVDEGASARVATTVTPLAAEHRRDEIARMLAGASITEEARAAANRLIENAR